MTRVETPVSCRRTTSTSTRTHRDAPNTSNGRTQVRPHDPAGAGENGGKSWASTGSFAVGLARRRSAPRPRSWAPRSSPASDPPRGRRSRAATSASASRPRPRAGTASRARSSSSSGIQVAAAVYDTLTMPTTKNDVRPEPGRVGDAQRHLRRVDDQAPSRTSRSTTARRSTPTPSKLNMDAWKQGPPVPVRLQQHGRRDRGRRPDGEGRRPRPRGPRSPATCTSRAGPASWRPRSSPTPTPAPRT